MCSESKNVSEALVKVQKGWSWTLSLYWPVVLNLLHHFPLSSSLNKFPFQVIFIISIFGRYNHSPHLPQAKEFAEINILIFLCFCSSFHTAQPALSPSPPYAEGQTRHVNCKVSSPPFWLTPTPRVSRPQAIPPIFYLSSLSFEAALISWF